MSVLLGIRSVLLYNKTKKEEWKKYITGIIAVYIVYIILLLGGYYIVSHLNFDGMLNKI